MMYVVPLRELSLLDLIDLYCKCVELVASSTGSEPEYVLAARRESVEEKRAEIDRRLFGDKRGQPA